MAFSAAFSLSSTLLLIEPTRATFARATFARATFTH